MWLTIKINPPAVDKPILARTANKYGFGHHYEVFTFSGDTFNEDDAAAHLENHSFIEWMEIPE